MNILEVYNKYNIMPQLQEHQLRVAGVAYLICKNFKLRVNQDNIVKACLLHDMGNILKFDFSVTKKYIQHNLDYDYWEKVKKDYENKYGKDEHVATLSILQELKVGNEIVELVDSIGFTQAVLNLNGTDFAKKICAYADMRVRISGVCSLEERLQDIRVRYEHKTAVFGEQGTKQREGFENSLRGIEQQIFTACNILAKEITPELVEQQMNFLKMFEI